MIPRVLAILCILVIGLGSARSGCADDAGLKEHPLVIHDLPKEYRRAYVPSKPKSGFLLRGKIWLSDAGWVVVALRWNRPEDDAGNSFPGGAQPPPEQAIGLIGLHVKTRKVVFLTFKRPAPAFAFFNPYSLNQIAKGSVDFTITEKKAANQKKTVTWRWDVQRSTVRRLGSPVRFRSLNRALAGSDYDLVAVARAPERSTLSVVLRHKKNGNQLKFRLCEDMQKCRIRFIAGLKRNTVIVVSEGRKKTRIQKIEFGKKLRYVWSIKPKELKHPPEDDTWRLYVDANFVGPAKRIPLWIIEKHGDGHRDRLWMLSSADGKLERTDHLNSDVFFRSPMSSPLGNWALLFAAYGKKDLLIRIGTKGAVPVARKFPDPVSVCKNGDVISSSNFSISLIPHDQSKSKTVLFELK